MPAGKYCISVPVRIWLNIRGKLFSVGFASGHAGQVASLEKGGSTDRGHSYPLIIVDRCMHWRHFLSRSGRRRLGGYIVVIVVSHGLVFHRLNLAQGWLSTGQVLERCGIHSDMLAGHNLWVPQTQPTPIDRSGTPSTHKQNSFDCHSHVRYATCNLHETMLLLKSYLLA